MKLFFCCLVSVLLIAGCSKEDKNNPVNSSSKYSTASGFLNTNVNSSNWFSDKVEYYKEKSNIYLRGTKNIEDNPNYSFSQIEIKIINLNQPGTYGIGENEPGYTYFVKASYLLKSNSDNNDKLYKAYYNDFSILTISRIDQYGIEADFDFNAFSESFTDSVEVTGGRLKIDY